MRRGSLDTTAFNLTFASGLTLDIDTSDCDGITFVFVGGAAGGTINVTGLFNDLYLEMVTGFVIGIGVPAYAHFSAYHPGSDQLGVLPAGVWRTGKAIAMSYRIVCTAGSVLVRANLQWQD